MSLLLELLGNRAEKLLQQPISVEEVRMFTSLWCTKLFAELLKIAQEQLFTNKVSRKHGTLKQNLDECC